MFASLSRFRRLVAVLSALALMASVLAAAPAVAADDPIADYTATFSACEGVAGSGPTFEDVPAGHENAGDIDCIAYYGITKGTGDGTTYSPSMSVTREQMALFLTRLAGLVGIEVASDPSDAGFVDIGELSAESQTAINQLADLGITRGTSETTYSPADAVTRGHMALFIARLMDNMTPIGGDKSEWGHTPSDVVEDEDDDIEVGSPFTDLGSVTKSTYDAITELWELGVASGINATSYAPQASIIRATMADFMAGVLDHSNARPVGVSMQAVETEGLGMVRSDIVVSYRDDSFAPMVDISLAIFTASDATGAGAAPFNEDTGKCTDTVACEWTDSDFLTNAEGNYVIEGGTVPTDNDEGGSGNMENSETWYAWMGDEDNTDFVKGSSGEASVTLTAYPNALGIRVTTDLNPKATTNTVDVGKDQTVVITAQLVDELSTSTTFTDANAVAKAGVSLAVTYSIGGTPANPPPDPVETDADGKATFTITHPGDDEDNDDPRQSDIVTFRGNVDGDDGNSVEEGTITVIWSDDAPAISDEETSVDSPYAVVDDDEVSIRATVSYFDQFGDPDAQGEDVTVTFTSTNTGTGNIQAKTVEVRSNGSVSTRGIVKADPGDTVAVTFSEVGGQTGTTQNVIAVEHASKRDITTAAAAVTVYADDNRFRYTTASTDSGVETGNLYSYDDDDVYILDGQPSDMDAFETAIEDGAHVQVVSYSTDDKSIFSAESQ